MNTSQLFSGKFSTAKLPEICAPRHELVRMFQREEGRRIVFVSAPAGYGKTVSTLLWLAASGRETVWIALDSYDNNPSIFYKLFCAGILSLQPDNRAMADILSSPGFSSSPVEHSISLLSEFIPDGKQYALVLDDMHLVSNEELRKAGLLVQKRMPSSFLTLILSRNPVAEDYIAIVGEDNCALFTAPELAFSAQDIQQYFAACGQELSDAEACSVLQTTNGWAIGVNALAMSGQRTPEQISSLVLGDYIRTQIWDKWDEKVQEFLLRTAVIDDVPLELASRLTGFSNSREILDKLCAQNAFISRTGTDTYRYHPLFVDFLREMHQEGSKRALYRIACEYYLGKEEYFNARRYAIKSGDADVISKASYALVQNNGKSVSIDEYVAFYRAFFQDAVSEEVFRQHPYIYTSYAWFYFLTGNAAKTEYYLDVLYQFLPIILEKYPQFTESTLLLSVIDHRRSFGELIESFAAFQKQSPWVSSFSKATDTLQGASISMQLPFAHRSIRNYTELIDEKLMTKLTSTFGALLKTQSDTAILAVRSGLLYEQNLLREALDNALLARSAAGAGTGEETTFCSFAHLAAVYYAMGLETQGAEVMTQAEQYINDNELYYLRHNFSALKTKFLLLDSDRSVAEMWLSNYFVTEIEHLDLYKIFQHFVTARAYMVLAQTDNAKALIIKLKKLAVAFRRPLDAAEAGALLAALEWALGNREEALRVLEETLVATQEYGFTRIVADEGAAVLPILKKLALKLKKTSLSSALNPLFLNEVIIAAYEQSKRHKGVAIHITDRKPVRLSKQQKYVLGLLAKGYKNAEIAKLTGLTIHTVKSHCAAAYAKLNVSSAMDAVLKAKELGIIK